MRGEEQTGQGLAVLGMHRSGTSLVTRVLNLLGMSLGPEQDRLAARPDNPGGYWEQRPIMEVNDAILEALGGSWSHPPDMPPGWIRRPEVEALATRGREVMVSQFGHADRWAWKDPRTSLTLPFWRGILPAGQSIVCFRSPLDVAASFLRRGGAGHTSETAMALWLRYSVAALDNTEGDDRLLVFYDDWFHDREAQLGRLASFAGYDPARIPAAVLAKIDAFIDANLRHHHTTATDVAEADGLAAEGKALYLAVRAAHLLTTSDSTEPGLAAAVRRLGPQLAHAGACHLRRHQEELARARAELELARRTERQLEVTQRRLARRVDAADQALAETQAMLRRERAAREAMESSASWRLTRPLRLSKRTVTSRSGSRPAAPGAAPGQNGGGAGAAEIEAAPLEFSLDRRPADRPRRARPERPRKLLVPCSDWSVSGVNTSLEAFGAQLIELGWGVELVFTRDEGFVRESAAGGAHMPRLPHRYLERPKAGVPGMWEALIREVEEHAPCLLLMGYDFLGNSVAPALSERVGVVSWIQADDGDYYEQAYRLGRYCNAVVCVAEHIRQKVVSLNPALAERAEVVHNSSVSRDDVAAARQEPAPRIRIVYSGRLVQYQKRILDFIDLAAALEATGAPYEISLIGTFSRHEQSEELFQRLAQPYLEDGRIRLLGRLGRDELLSELTRHEFFVLLSDFEGLPLSLTEAMARGCVPVVAASESGIPEIIDQGQNGFMVRGRDYDAWASLLVELWQDQSRLSALSECARRTVREGFAIEDLARRLDRVLGQVADEVASGEYRRPPSLHWGGQRSPAGDVLPPPSLYRPTLAGMPGLTARQRA